MRQTPASFLWDAVAKGGPAVISVQWPLGKIHFRTRFLPEASRIVLERPAGQGGEAFLEKAVAGLIPVVVNFRRDSANYQFTGTLTPAGPKSLLVGVPEQVVEVQRRQTYRVPLAPADAAARAVRASKIPSYAALRDRPARSQEFEGRLLDLSPLGMSLVCLPFGNERVSLAPQQRLRLMIQGLDEGELLLGGCVKHIAPLPGDRLRVGLEFRQAEYDVKDRQNLAALTPVLALLQRAEAKQSRDPAAAPPVAA